MLFLFVLIIKFNQKVNQLKYQRLVVTNNMDDSHKTNKIMMDTEHKLLKGGAFLVEETDPNSVFIVEDLTEEQEMVLGMVKEFVEKRVMPQAAQIESLDLELTKKHINAK